MRWIAIFVLVACGRARVPRVVCPAGTKPESNANVRGCKNAADHWHGPFVALFDDGKVYKRGSFDDGVWDGHWTVYGRDGRVVGEFTLTNGTGTLLDWDEEGHKLQETPYRGGKIDGVARAWHPNGQPASEATFQAGWQQGPMTRWSETGRITYKASYDDGKPHGVTQTFDASGQLEREETYEHGVRTRDVTYAGGKVTSDVSTPVEQPGTQIATRDHAGIDPAWQVCEQHYQCELVALGCCACGANNYVAVNFHHADAARTALHLDCQASRCPAQSCDKVWGRCEAGRCVSAN